MEKRKIENVSGLFEKVDLTVKEPVPGLDLTWGISFRSENEKQNSAYKQAVSEICKKHKLGSFHQVEGDFNSGGHYTGKGYHQFDFWNISPNINPSEAQRTIENLFEEIHARAQEIASGT